MSQPELIRELRAAKPVAPAELRERVRLVGTQAPPTASGSWWRRRSLFVVVPVAAALAIAGALVATRSHPASPVRTLTPARDLPYAKVRAGAAVGALDHVRPALPAPSSTRLQNYTASLSLQVRSNRAVSDVSKQAVAIARSLSGYAQSVNVAADTGTGRANLVLKVPKLRVADAVRRVAALGTILSENVSVEDVQANVNATDRLIASLQRQLAALRRQPQTKHNLTRIEQLTARIENKQRQRTATVHAAHYATVDLRLTTKAPAAKGEPGPLHGIGTAFRWVGIVLVYALALGTPLALVAFVGWLTVRTLRRRREAELLSRP